MRTWWSALGVLEHTRYGDRVGIARRWVLRAMGEAAMKTGSRYVAFGVRSLSVATGLDHTTVAAHLRALREEDDPLIDLIENDRGLAGDLYQLRIPDEIADRASRVAWRPGKLHALRPVFRELGHPAAFVYEALEHGKGPQRSFDLVTRRPGCPGPRCTRRWKPSPRGTWWNRSTAGGSSCPAPACNCWPSSSAAWSRSAPRSVGTAANGPRTGGRCASSTTTPRPPTVGPVEEAEAYLWPPEPPPEDGETLMDLLHRELGAYLISG